MAKLFKYSLAFVSLFNLSLVGQCSGSESSPVEVVGETETFRNELRGIGCTEAKVSLMTADQPYMFINSRPNLRGISSALTSIGNSIENPMEVTDVSIVFCSPVGSLIEKMSLLNEPGIENMIENIAKHYEDKTKTGTFVLEGINSWDDVKDIAFRRRPLSQIIPVQKLELTNITVYARKIATKSTIDTTDAMVKTLTAPSGFSKITKELQQYAMPIIFKEKTLDSGSILDMIKSVSEGTINTFLTEIHGIQALKKLDLMAQDRPENIPAEQFMAAAGKNDDVLKDIAEPEILIYQEEDFGTGCCGCWGKTKKLALKPSSLFS
ncbi:MAG: hypothetical protein LBI26_03970 [Holosporales bacterium]|jgi:hypothetical protein|nr:hypothetical protein [Holosporales bacterium]